MSPQPLFKVKRDCSITFGDPETLKLESELAVSYAAAIATWSYAESFYGNILVQLLGAQAAPSLAMLQVLTSSTAQDQALDAAATATLAGERLALTQAAIAAVRRLRRRRNILAHGVIGRVEDLPGAIVIADARVLQKHWLEMFVKRPLTSTIDRSMFSKQAFDALLKETFVYRRKDLDELTVLFDDAATILINVAVISSQVHHGLFQALEELRSAPGIQSELRRQQKNPKDPRG